MKKVLIVEDDKRIAELLDIHLSDMDFSVDKSYRGNDAMTKILSSDYDLILLDLMLPEMDGQEICTRLRNADIQTPVIMITARTEEQDKIDGLEGGADDYITKPFSVLEFKARVKALMRRFNKDNDSTSDTQSNEIIVDPLSINIDKRKVTLNGARLDLTPKEFDLLVLLASSPGKSYSRTQILNLVWGYDFEGFEHTVNSHVNRLRSKIEVDMAKPKFILTTWGYGYRFNEEV